MNVPGDVVAYDARSGPALCGASIRSRRRENTAWKPGGERTRPSGTYLTGTHDWVREYPELLDASWKYTGNVGHWAPVTADEELGLFYVPTETPDKRLFRRLSAGREPLRELRGGARRGDRRAGLAFLAHPSRTLGLRSPDGSHPPRHRGRWCPGEGLGSALEAGVCVRARPCDRRTRLADRGTGSAAVGRSGRVDISHTALSHQAACL